MKAENDQHLISKAPFGYAYHKIILDDEGKPIDYEFIEVNHVFEKLTGLKSSDILNSTITKAIPEITRDTFDWIGFYGEIATHGGEKEFEQFSEILNRWYKVLVYSPQINYFVTVFTDITDNKLVEEKLAKEKRRLLGILGGSNVGTWEWNIQTGEAIFNGRWAEMIGYTLEEISPISIEIWNKYTHPDDLKVLGELLEMHFKGESDHYECEARMKHKNGDWVWVLDRGKVHEWDEEGKPLLMSGTHQDITERKQMESALKESKNRLRDITFSMADWVWEVDEKGVYTYSSQKSFGHAGAFREYVIGKKPFDFMPPEEAKRVAAIFSEIIANKAPIKDLENWNIGKNGERICLLTNGVPILDENGNLKGYRGVDKDITGRKHAEELLLQSNNKWEAIISASPDGIGMADLDGKISLLSDSLFSMYGYPIDKKEESLGRNIFEFIDVSSHPKLKENISKLLSGGDTGVSEYLGIKQDGTRFFVEINSAVLRNSAGKPVEILFIERDITERKRTEEELKHKNEQLHTANAEKDKFFSIVAHDLRSPFNVFLGFTQTMVEKLDTMPLKEIQEMLALMKNSATSLHRLLENLLEWSLMQRGMTSFNPVSFLLMPKISETLLMVLQLANEKRIIISYNVPEDLMVNADTQMFESMMRNLVFNSVKFTSKGGNISIAAKLIPGNSIEISVKDTGVGMNKRMIDHLFRFDEMTTCIGTEGEPGTGLGLMICKDFVEKHGGKLWVESEEGKGTTFSFTLPNIAAKSELTDKAYK